MHSEMFVCVSNVFHSFRETQAEIFSYDSYLIERELNKIRSICRSKKFIVFCSRMIMKAGSRVW